MLNNLVKFNITFLTTSFNICKDLLNRKHNNYKLNLEGKNVSIFCNDCRIEYLVETSKNLNEYYMNKKSGYFYKTTRPLH